MRTRSVVLNIESAQIARAEDFGVQGRGSHTGNPVHHEIVSKALLVAFASRHSRRRVPS
jgi:hypothetical protein